MDRAGRDEERIPRMYAGFCHKFGKRAPLDVFGVLFPGDGPVESDAERGVGAAVDHVPHFGFAVGAVPLGGQIVVRMHLDR